MNSIEQPATPNRRSPASGGYAALDYDAWEKQGGDTDGIMRTVCHDCDRMWPMAAMSEDSRFDNICPSCVAERHNEKLSEGGPDGSDLSGATPALR